MTLVELGAKEAIPALTTLLYDNNPYQRTYALQSLVKVNGKSAASEIVRLFDDENANNRYWALDALIKLDARAYSGKFRQLIGSNQTAQTESYAIAGLVYFGDAKAIEIAGQKLSENKEEDRYLLEQLVELKARKIVPTLISILEKADYSRENAYKFPTAIIYALGKFEAREAAPVLRTVIEKNSLAGKIPAIQVLGNFEDKDAVDDLLNVFYKSLPEPPDRITNATYDSAEAALALAKIGDKKVWKDLIDAAANPKYPYRSQIIVELNKHLDKELWQKTMTKQVSSQRFVSIKEIADDFSRKTEIPVVLHFEVGKDAAKRRPIANEVIDTNGYPWTSISEGTSLLDGLREIPKSISDGTLPQNFTFIFDKNQIHILTVEKAVKWWRENILRTENKDART
jgi:HEAT repeat protein